MAEESGTPAPPAVSDRRPVPRGVLPRGFQTWLMAGLALGIVLIILIAGRPEPPSAPGQTAPAPLAPNPDRLRDYQERLRAMEARQTQDGQSATPAAAAQQPVVEPSAPKPEDPFERCATGLPEWFDGNVDSYWIASRGDVVACAAPDATIYRSDDGCVSWRTLATGLPAPRAVLVDD